MVAKGSEAQSFPLLLSRRFLPRRSRGDQLPALPPPICPLAPLPPPPYPYNPRRVPTEVLTLSILESKLVKNDAFTRRAEHWRAEIARLRDEETTIRLGGGLKAQERQRSQGKLTAR